MSESNRGGVDKARLKQWLTGAVLIALIFICVGSIQHWIYYNEASSHAAGYARDAQNQMATECRVPLATPDCESKIDRAARQEQRDEYDLYSQKAMALWTAIMGAMAVIGVSLSGVGVYLIWGTWRQTSEAAESARKTLRSYVAKERAVLIPQSANEALDIENIAEGFVVHLFNAGQSPGRIVETEWSYIRARYWPNSFDHQSRDIRVLMPEGNGRTPHLAWDDAPDHSRPIYLVGRITYETLESEVFETFFGFSVGWIDDDGYRSASWEAAHEVIRGQPDNT